MDKKQITQKSGEEIYTSVVFNSGEAKVQDEKVS
jgi:hypothetical protein